MSLLDPDTVPGDGGEAVLAGQQARPFQGDQPGAVRARESGPSTASMRGRLSTAIAVSGRSSERVSERSVRR